MRTAEEILLSKEVKYFDWLRMKGTTPSAFNAIIQSINEARKEVIEECEGSSFGIDEELLLKINELK